MSAVVTSAELDYYTAHGPLTDPGPAAASLDGLPRDIRALARIVQGLVYHYFADEALFGWKPPADRLVEIDTRHAAAMLARLRALDPRPLT